MKERFVCTECGHELERGQLTAFDNAMLCPSCLENLTVTCRCCGDRIWREDATDEDLCERCYENYYVHCENCGDVIHEDDAYYFDSDDDRYHPYCSHCYSQEERPIHDYSYKPEPIFYGDDDALFMGVELEVDDGGECSENAETLLDIGNSHGEHIYIKHDGSLDEGFEIVTHPMTLRYHMQAMPWLEIMSKAIHMGYRSHKSCTCGLHIHVNRNSFGCSYLEQENAIARLVYFYEKFWAEILRFSRRTQEQANHWASRYGGVLASCKKSLEDAKKSNIGRYSAVNLTNSYTVEFRIFRGSLRYNTVIATLQFTHYLCKLAAKKSDSDFHGMSWSEFVSGIPQTKYPELIDYLKVRRLYINEPVAESEEI